MGLITGFKQGLARGLLLTAGLGLAGAVYSQGRPEAGATPRTQNQSDIRMQEDAPLRYVVKKGDTLWGISKKYLKDAWQWPEVWTTNNTKVTNPHLIYPGQELLLVYKDKRPQVMPSGDLVTLNDTDKLSPRVRELPLDQAIPTIPIDQIRQFLRGPRVVTDDELERAPYVVDFNEPHLVGAGNMGAYVKNIAQPVMSGYAVVRRGDEYRDPETGELLGYEAIPTAEAEVREYGKLSTVRLVESSREVNVGDRLLPLESGLFEANFYPHAPAQPVGGRVISVFDGMSQIGQFQIVTLNRGTRHGLEPGHVLSILRAGGRVKDPYEGGKVQLPDQFAGTLLIFKVSPKVSYGLVMEAVRPIHLLDKAEKPRPGEQG
jgi:hypothetical protein